MTDNKNKDVIKVPVVIIPIDIFSKQIMVFLARKSIDAVNSKSDVELNMLHKLSKTFFFITDDAELISFFKEHETFFDKVIQKYYSNRDAVMVFVEMRNGNIVNLFELKADELSSYGGVVELVGE